jgi:hypothetical protein
MYDEAGFEASVATHAARDPGARALLESLLADVRAHLGGLPAQDDTTCLVLRRVATPGAEGPSAPRRRGSGARS